MYELITEIFPGYEPNAVLRPDGRWEKLEPPMMEIYADDVWASPDAVIKHPQHEQLMVMIMETIVAAGHCRKTGPKRFGLIDNHFNHYFKGDAFDEHNGHIDRNKISLISNNKVLEFYDYFTQDPSRCMLRLADRINDPSENNTHDEVLIGRRVRIEIALKVFLVMRGHDYCQRSIPRGFLMLEEYMRKQKINGG